MNAELKVELDPGESEVTVDLRRIKPDIQHTMKLVDMYVRGSSEVVKGSVQIVSDANTPPVYKKFYMQNIWDQRATFFGVMDRLPKRIGQAGSEHFPFVRQGPSVRAVWRDEQDPLDKGVAALVTLPPLTAILTDNEYLLHGLDMIVREVKFLGETWYGFANETNRTKVARSRDFHDVTDPFLDVTALNATAMVFDRNQRGNEAEKKTARERVKSDLKKLAQVKRVGVVAVFFADQLRSEPVEGMFDFSKPAAVASEFRRCLAEVSEQLHLRENFITAKLELSPDRKSASLAVSADATETEKSAAAKVAETNNEGLALRLVLSEGLAQSTGGGNNLTLSLGGDPVNLDVSKDNASEFMDLLPLNVVSLTHRVSRLNEKGKSTATYLEGEEKCSVFAYITRTGRVHSNRLHLVPEGLPARLQLIGGDLTPVTVSRRLTFFLYLEIM